jgi:drug/metabolite transporter (DMT)-like permease
MDFIIKRLQEPSTYAGIAAFLTGFGLLGLTEHDWNQIFGAFAALAGVVAIFVRETPGSSSNGAQ